jgi:hypothetical protein
MYATGAIGLVEAAEQQLEQVLGFRDADGELVFRVPSHGCTSKEDFEARVSPHLADAHEVTVGLVRKRQDSCKGFFREGAEIAFTRRELGLAGDIAVQPANLQTLPLKPR